MREGDAGQREGPAGRCAVDAEEHLSMVVDNRTSCLSTRDDTLNTEGSAAGKPNALRRNTMQARRGHGARFAIPFGRRTQNPTALPSTDLR
jgi:hypothetical protein